VSVLPPDRCRAQRAHRREMRVISLRVTPPLRVSARHRLRALRHLCELWQV